MIRIATFALLILAGAASAEIYQWTDTDGKVHYSDSIPPSGKTKDGIKQRDESNLPGITTLEQQEFREPVYIEQESNKGSINDNWNQCAATKRQAVAAEKRRARTAEQLNEWLWQNCRHYSNELRTIEQQMM